MRTIDVRPSASLLLAILAAVGSVACDASDAEAAPTERLVGGPCEGCEAVFEGRPAKLVGNARIAPETERGEPLAIEGFVRDAAGNPVAGVIVYAYQTDATGIYPQSPPGTKHRHGKLRGFAKTDARGRYAFGTIRPAGYPGTDLPRHVHMHVVEPGRCHYTIDDLVFTDDPRLTRAQRESHSRGRGSIGVVTPTKTVTKHGTSWGARRDIVLGAGIADYDRCGKR